MRKESSLGSRDVRERVQEREREMGERRKERGEEFDCDKSRTI